MEFTYSNDGFVPYESFDNIYADKEQPEFGKVPSKFVKRIDTWRFMLANGESEIPFGFESPSFDDSAWNFINTPSTWQTEGYGMPQNLLYNYPEEMESAGKNGNSISDRYVLKSTSAEDDEIGIYRTTIVFSPEDINRAIYLETSGISGSFAVYLNGQLQCESQSVVTRKRLLLSDCAKPGVNQLAIIVYRYDRDSHGHVIKDLMNYGFSGIFRPVYIVFESLLEISNLHIKLDNVPAAYVTEIANAGGNLPDAKKRIARVPHGDYRIKVDFAVRNHTDYYMPFKVKFSLLEARGEYDLYNLPFVNMKEEMRLESFVDAHNMTREQSELVAFDVAMWSDATPVQYDLAIQLLDSEGRVICAKKKRFGFRTTEIVLDKLNINDRRMNLMMVKYYEFDPEGGISVPIDRMRQDIILMKRAGINAVLVNGMPVSDEFLNLCDQYGIYVVATTSSRYIRDYVEAAMNHPSVVFWGVQDYHFDAGEAGKAKAECNMIDGTRPWYCGVDFDKKVSDVPPFPGDSYIVFGPWQDLCLYRSKIFKKNKTGKNLFETIQGRTRFTDDDADYKWIHHADLVGGKQKDDSSIGQGIVDAERNPHPIYLDIKKQCQTLSIFSSPEDPTTLTLRNANPFAYTSELELEWKIMLGGHKLMSGRGDISEIEPYGTRTLRFPIDVGQFLVPGWAGDKAEFVELYMNALSHELLFDISLKLAKDTYYAGAGYEIAFYQDVLASEIASPAKTNEGERLQGINAYNVGNLGLASGEEEKVAALPSASQEESGAEYIEPETENESEEEEDTFQEGLSRMDDEVVHDTGVDTIIDADTSDVQKGAELTRTPNNIAQDEQLTIMEEVPEYQAMAEEDIPQEENLEEVINRNNVFASPRGISVGNDEFRVSFNRDLGAIDSIEINGYNFLKGGFKPSFYRCPSNIDRTDKSFVLAKTIFSKESDYESIQQSLKYKDCTYSTKDGVFSLIARYTSFAMKGDVVVFYEIPSVDKIRITLDFTPKYDLIRYGFRVPLVKEDILCSWYGRGPGESYYDRKNATRLGLFAAGADKIYHPYARPAENSSHTDTKIIKITNANGDGFTVKRADKEKFDFTVLPYTPEQMNEYLHEEQLMSNDFCELFTDFCSKEIERTIHNTSVLPLKKNVKYSETFEIDLIKNV